MSNELLFLIVMLLDLGLVLLAFRLGRPFLYAVMIGNIMFTNMVSSKIVNIFGFDGTIGNVFYASIFLATDLLSEHHGKKYATQAVWLGFFGLMLIILFGPLIKMFMATDYSSTQAAALDVIFGQTERIAVASIIAYVIANNFDIWWYAKIHQRFSTVQNLYVRNIGSTIVSQFLDNSVFVILAFAGAVPNRALWQIWVAGYAIKVIVAIGDTPFMYLSYALKSSIKQDKA